MNPASRKRKRENHQPRSIEYFDSSDSGEEFDFENVDLEKVVQDRKVTNDETSSSELTIKLQAQDETKTNRRYPTTAIARKIRLEVHKLHLLCLMKHVSIRNMWCSGDEIRKALQPIQQRFRGNVHPNTTSAQIQRTRVLLEGLEALSVLWSKSYKITTKGLSGSKWYAEDDLNKVLASGTTVGTEVSRKDFLRSATLLEGDRDVGAQLLVALLRLLGLTTRLVCSLQPLSLSVNKNNTAVIIEEQVSSESDNHHLPDEDITQRQPKRQPRGLSRPKLGVPSRRPPPTRPKPQIKLVEPIVQSPYPIYWAEVFDPAAQKWYPVDPLVTDTVNRADMFEPPQSEADNTLSYVVSFEQDGSARDVTHRYTRQFNAKVRKSRVDSIPSGALWWSKIMKLYKSRYNRNRNAIEESELAQRALSEGIPSNVSDLVGHPLFVLERHLRKDEIIQPLRECGTIRVGKTQPPVVEKVYPRKHVLRLKSSLAWYMRGRQVKVGEQPLKMVEKRSLHTTTDDDQESDNSYKMIQEGLYAEHQTDVYVPDLVSNGIVPKNAYGNVDLFQPSMLPPGSSHIPTRDAEKIAQLLGIDYAIACTGFDHTNRGMTVPIKTGVVVASEFVEAMQAVQEAVLAEAEEEAKREKTLIALRRWNQFLRSLRIKDHVDRRYVATE